jgi:membrane protein implicated in regulation of membrane protease activity
MHLDYLAPYFINLSAVLLLVRGLYYRHEKRTDLFLTFFGFNTIIFFVATVLNQVEMSTGAAFGMFAVFSILRYRTEGLSAKDMTYLFLSIALGLLGATTGDMGKQAMMAAVILAMVFVLDSGWVIKKEKSMEVLYDNIALAHVGQRAALVEDLKQRTGLNVIRCEVSDLDYLKDACKVTLYYVD